MSSGIRPVCITVPLETMQRIASALEIAAESARELRLELEDHVERLRPRPSRVAP